MNTQSIDQQIMKKIDEQRLTMRSNRSIATRRVWFIVLMTLCAVFMVFLASFMLYALHRTGVLYLPLIGGNAFTYLLHPFSWFTGSLFFGGPVLVVIIGVLVWKKARFYRIPLLYVWLFLGTSFLAVGALVFMTPLHGALRSRQLPVFGALYDAATCVTETHTATGLVREATPDGFELVTLSRKLVTVRIDGSTVFHNGYSVQNGDAVIVIGQISNSMMIAEIVEPSPARLSEEETRELCNIDISEDDSE